VTQSELHRAADGRAGSIVRSTDYRRKAAVMFGYPSPLISAPRTIGVYGDPERKLAEPFTRNRAKKL